MVPAEDSPILDSAHDRVHAIVEDTLLIDRNSARDFSHLLPIYDNNLILNQIARIELSELYEGVEDGCRSLGLIDWISLLGKVRTISGLEGSVCSRNIIIAE